MSSHLWVALSYQPITVELQEDGTLHTFTHPEAEEVAREDSFLCCYFCERELTVDSFGSECEGANNVDGSLDIESAPNI
jgi:hypothetical protein